MMKKILALAMCVLFVCMAGTAMAATSGYCGKPSNEGGANSVTWTLADDGTLTISGTGAMYDYWVGADSPWKGSKSVKKVVIENGVTSIGSYAFDDCCSLTSVTIADTVTSIGDSAFAGNYSLGTVSFGENSQLGRIESQAFFSCKVLEEITLPAGVENISTDAFVHCDALEAIHIVEGGETYKSEKGVVYTANGDKLWIYPKGKKDSSYVIPDGVTEIGSVAFGLNAALTHVTIPASVTKIGTQAFWNCDCLENVVFSGDSRLTTIEESAFAYCGALKTLTIPASVTAIGENVFNGCDALTAVNVAEGNTWYKSMDGVLYTADGTKLMCYPMGKSGVSFTTPEGVTTIGEKAFCDNAKLKTVILSEGVTTIGQEAFLFSSLETITIPASVAAIGTNAFNGCDALKTVNVPCNWNGSLYAFGEGVTKTYHSPVYTASGNTLTESCGVCKEEFGTAAITAVGGDYNGAPYTAAVAKTGTLADRTFGIIYTRSGEEINETPVSAGSYTASITRGGATASVDFEIKKIDSAVIAAPTANTLTYTGGAQALVAKGEAAGGTMVYSLDGVNFSAEIPTGTGAGDYAVYYQVQGDENHNDSAVGGPVRVTIAAKPEEQAPDAQISGKSEAGSYTDAPTLTAPQGCEISLTPDSWTGETDNAIRLPAQDGEHTYTYYIRLPDGTIAEKTVTLTADITPPQVAAPQILADPTKATITVAATDAVSGVMDIRIKVISGKGNLVIEGNGDGSYTVTGLIPGETYSFTLIVSDWAGHETKMDITITAPLMPTLPQTGDASLPMGALLALLTASTGMLCLLGRKKA